MSLCKRVCVHKSYGIDKVIFFSLFINKDVYKLNLKLRMYSVCSVCIVYNNCIILLLFKDRKF